MWGSIVNNIVHSKCSARQWLIAVRPWGLTLRILSSEQEFDKMPDRREFRGFGLFAEFDGLAVWPRDAGFAEASLKATRESEFKRSWACLRIAWKTLNPRRLRSVRGPSKERRAVAAPALQPATVESGHSCSPRRTGCGVVAWTVSPRVFEGPAFAGGISLEADKH